MSTTLTLSSLLPFAPVLVLSSTAVLLMLLLAFVRSHRLTLALTLTAPILALILILNQMYTGSTELPVHVTQLIAIDAGTHVYWSLILIGLIVCSAISYPYIQSIPSLREEWYLLLLVAATGALVLAASNHMASLFIGLELMSIPLYGLAAFPRQNKRALEAGIKYLVLSASSSAMQLFGIALIYADTGSLLMSDWANMPLASPLITLGCAMMLIGLGFKLSWVPFHTCTPDVYQGAPMPITTFLATASKAAVIATLVRLFEVVPIWQEAKFALLLSLIAGASILFGNLLALSQTSLKRLLAYSSIAHFGYLLVALMLVGKMGSLVIWVYLGTYIIPTLCAFAVMSTLSTVDSDDHGDSFDALRGLYHRNPLLALALGLSLLSMAGIPLTAGFIGKFLLFTNGMAANEWLLLLLIVLGSGIGIYYYLHTVSLLFKHNATLSSPAQVPVLNGALIIALSILTILLGVWPGLVMG
jgi:NADH-quinone oxidoreductase subunit N